AGVKDFVHEVVVGAPVKLVGARPHRDIEHTAADLAIFRGVVTGLNRGLLNRIDARLGLLGNAGGARVGRILTLDTERLRVGRRAVDAHQGVRYVVHARDYHHHVVRIPNAGAAGQRSADTQNGKVVQALDVDVMAQLAALRLQERGGFIYSDGLAGRADLQADIDAQGLRHFDGQTGARILLKSGHRDVDLVRA